MPNQRFKLLIKKHNSKEMEVKTNNPILLNPEDPNVNGYVGSSSVNIDLQGQSQDVNVGDFVVKGTNPVFVGNQEASRNEFLYSEPVMLGDETLTPNDEYLYSNAGGDERKANRDQRRINREAARKVARAKANETSPGKGEPSAAEQDAKAKEGKFWNVLKGGWEGFTKSPSGQVILDSATNYLSNRLGGNSFSQPGGDVAAPPADEPKAEPMSKTTKYVLIGGGVLLVGIILYNVLSKK
jgi:hypothetical protein